FRFDVESIVLDGQAIVLLKGELDMSTSERFGEVVRLLHSNGTTRLVIDLSELDFVDFSGLREIVVAQRRQREIGGDVVLHAPKAHVRRVLEIVGLDRILTIT
ncbi:MAG: STAS domain-containing protein, partial [Actinomycetota bacterium]|nr:STAS domain-containing protein [Actinomycetota bacterium]